MSTPSLSVTLLVLLAVASCLNFSSNSLYVGSSVAGGKERGSRPKSVDRPGEGRLNLLFVVLDESFLGSSVMAGRTWLSWEKTEELSLALLVTEFLLLLALDQGLILYLCDLKNSLFDLFLVLIVSS